MKHTSHTRRRLQLLSIEEEYAFFVTKKSTYNVYNFMIDCQRSHKTHHAVRPYIPIAYMVLLKTVFNITK